MNFGLAYLVHTHTHSPEHIVVDAKKKISAYIAYREERDALIIDIVKVILIILLTMLETQRNIES